MESCLLLAPCWISSSDCIYSHRLRQLWNHVRMLRIFLKHSHPEQHNCFYYNQRWWYLSTKGTCVCTLGAELEYKQFFYCYFRPPPVHSGRNTLNLRNWCTLASVMGEEEPACTKVPQTDGCLRKHSNLWQLCGLPPYYRLQSCSEIQFSTVKPAVS